MLWPLHGCTIGPACRGSAEWRMAHHPEIMEQTTSGYLSVDSGLTRQLQNGVLVCLYIQQQAGYPLLPNLPCCFRMQWITQSRIVLSGVVQTQIALVQALQACISALNSIHTHVFVHAITVYPVWIAHIAVQRFSHPKFLRRHHLPQHRHLPHSIQLSFRHFLSSRCATRCPCMGARVLI